MNPERIASGKMKTFPGAVSEREMLDVAVLKSS